MRKESVHIRALRDDVGNSGKEYALIAALVSILAIPAWQAIGDNLATMVSALMLGFHN